MKRTSHCAGIALSACVAAGLIAPLGAADPAGPPALQQLRESRKQLAAGKRRVIFNNDGCDCLYFPKSEKVTVENFLAKRTSPLAGTQVNVIAYCTISSGFGFFTHRTAAGTVLARQPEEFGLRPDMRNIAQDLIDQGTDCLQAVLEFAHQHRMECFWSMRMNDTHDAAYRPDQPYLLYPPLKVEHPDWLVGEPVKRSPFGRWSSVDYARPEIRDLAFSYIAEVCRNYDVDGIELDFFRHLCFFKSTAHGGVASDEERALLTEWLGRVRRMTEEVGLQRGRPILVLVRVPDAVEFCRGLGLDVEAWLREGLCDLLATTCYFRLNPWETSLALGHKYGVPVYPCISDARVKGEERFLRGSVESYRGQLLEAWAAGADGIHFFNLFDVFGGRAPVFQDAGDPGLLRSRDRLYFATVRDGKPRQWLADGDRHLKLPVLTPGAPGTVTAAQTLEVDLALGEAAGADSPAGKDATLHLRLPGLRRPGSVRVSWNGEPLAGGRREGEWLDLPVGPERLRPGANRVTVALAPPGDRAADEWSVAWEGEELPGKPWTCDAGSARVEAKVENGAMMVADRGEVPGDYLFFRYPWGADPSGRSVVEARVKVVSGVNRIIVTNGQAQERLELLPDRVALWSRRSVCHLMDTTGGFHVYRLVTQGKDVQVYVDGQLRLSAPGAYAKDGGGRNEVCFGAADSTSTGEAVWDSLRAQVDSQCCLDVVLSVRPRRAAPPEESRQP